MGRILVQILEIFLLKERFTFLTQSKIYLSYWIVIDFLEEMFLRLLFVLWTIPRGLKWLSFFTSFTGESAELFMLSCQKSSPYWVLKSSLYIWIKPFIRCDLQIFSPSMWAAFSFPLKCLLKSQFSILFLCLHLHMASQMFQHTCWKDHPFPTELPWHLEIR